MLLRRRPARRARFVPVALFAAAGIGQHTGDAHFATLAGEPAQHQLYQIVRYLHLAHHHGLNRIVILHQQRKQQALYGVLLGDSLARA